VPTSAQASPGFRRAGRLATHLSLPKENRNGSSGLAAGHWLLVTEQFRCEGTLLVNATVCRGMQRCSCQGGGALVHRCPTEG
jgi:hypothetical protein